MIMYIIFQDHGRWDRSHMAAWLSGEMSLSACALQQSENKANKEIYVLQEI